MAYACNDTNVITANIIDISGFIKFKEHSKTAQVNAIGIKMLSILPPRFFKILTNPNLD